MERTGGEPDGVGFDIKTGEYIFYDCSSESSTAAMTKSESVQTTSSVNCIAIKGMNNRSAKPGSVLFCANIFDLFIILKTMDLYKKERAD